jgi:hypothetical protein
MRFITDDIEALVLLGRLDEAAALLSRTEAKARTLDRASVLTACERCRGLVAAAEQKFDDAEAAFGRALNEHGRTVIPLERARTLLALGSLLRRMRRNRDGRETLEQAHAQFVQLGAVLWAQAAGRELARIGGRAPSN